MPIWIDENSAPLLLKSTVNGKPGFRVLPEGEDDDEILFTSREALVCWVELLQMLTNYPQDAQSYDEWLEDQQ